MNGNKFAMGLAIVAGAALALWAGLPPFFLLLLACPVMMIFMMGSMGGMHGGQRHDNEAKPSSSPAPDRSHERIDQP